MKTFFLFLFSSQVFSKLLFNDTLSKDVNICEEEHNLTKNEINELLNQSMVFSTYSNQKQLCFLECIYRTKIKIDEYELIQENGLIAVIRKINPFHSYSNTVLKFFSSNIVMLCSQNNDVREPCLRTVKRVECLEAMTYLHILGFLNKSITKSMINLKVLKIIMKVGVSKFQAFFGYYATGVLNSETLAALYSVSFIEDVTKPRYRRFISYKNKWKKNCITYEISKYSKTLPRELVDEEISRAFRLWASVIPINITFVHSGHGDIDIRFEKLKHGDVPFDGPGSVLAHTFYPITLTNGTQWSFIHFDDSENWTVNSTEGVDLFQTALHEIGHSLGLMHSNIDNSVMSPGHIFYTPNFTLSEDDIRGIQSLYGMNLG